MSLNRLNRLNPIALVFSILLLLATTGCVTESVDEQGTHAFKYELWVPLLTTAIGIVVLLVGFPLLKLIRKLGVACILGGGIGAFVIGPSMFFDSAIVHKERFSLRTGLWGMTAQHDFEYEQLSSARYVVEQSVDKKGRQKTTYSLICMHKNGDMQKVPLSNEVAKTAASQLVAQLIESGVPVTDQSSSGQEMFNQNIGEIRPTTFTPQFLTD